MRVYPIVLSSVVCPVLQTFPHYLINGTIFEKKKKLFDINLFFDFLYNFYLKYFSFEEELSEI